MGDIQARSLGSPDETRTFDRGRVEVANVGGSSVGRITLEPGWRWQESLKPITGTDSCPYHHLGYALSGRIHIVTDEGAEMDISAGEAYAITPGHDAWVVGDEPYVALEFRSAAEYAQR